MTDDSSTRGMSVFVTGLKNAHALENQALELMNRQIERIENYPQIAARMKQHVDETHGQVTRLETILDSVGESRSILKDNVLSVTGNLAAITHAFMQDEILKNSFANFAFENFEIASYKSLIAVANGTGHHAAVPHLQKTLDEELSMAQWLDQHLEETTKTYLQRAMSGEKSGI